MQNERLDVSQNSFCLENKAVKKNLMSKAYKMNICQLSKSL